jgi:hypothetical protein
MHTTMDSANPGRPRTPAIRQVTVLLPVAPPQTYLQWMRWWRRSQRQTRALIAGGDLLTRLALAPHPAELLWDVIGNEISRQAGLAKRQGRTTVMPRIRTTDVVLVRALGYMDRRQRFLESGQANAGAGVAAPSLDSTMLRMRLVRSVGRQLTASATTTRRRWTASPVEPVDVPTRRRARTTDTLRSRSRGRSHERRRPGQAA